MNIIVMREADASARRITLTIGHIALGAMLLFGVVPLVLGGLAFWVSGLYAPPASGTRGQLRGLQQTVARVQRLRALSRTELSGLAQDIGTLRAQTSRLDVLGSRLDAFADIRPAVWHVPNRAPLMPTDPSKDANWTLASLQTLSAKLHAALAYKEMELTALGAVLAARQVNANTTPGGWPVRGGWISSPFGPRPNPFTGRPGFHPGVDIAAPTGTPVRAMAAGIVIFAGLDGGFGRLIKVFDGHNEVTMYAHLSARYVHVGEIIHKHQLLGRVGDTGYSTGPHLHFEVLLHGTPINPIGFLHIADRR